MPRRLLLGSHDVEGFTTKMARWPAVRVTPGRFRGNAGSPAQHADD
jgi:hypothetical protein